MGVEIGSFEAKTKLSELLRRVQGGAHYTITHRGKPVAELLPVGRGTVTAVAQAVERMQSFKRVKGVSGQDLAEWIAEGRAVPTGGHRA
jgi:prevent-host-death family protein